VERTFMGLPQPMHRRNRFDLRVAVTADGQTDGGFL
jgi:hypothetical protein